MPDSAVDSQSWVCLSKESDLSRLAVAVLRTIAYSDVFDYPLTATEIQRYLVRVPASSLAVESILDDDRFLPRLVARRDGYYTLSGREGLLETRRRRARTASHMWDKAQRYGLAIASLPFVRMVAVTGTLAVNNVDSGADIDYLIVTTSSRLWLARSLTILCVYIARLEGVEICPNYLLTLDTLEQFDRSLFTAHEIAQMRILYGLDVYRELIHRNDWVYAFLPNAFDLRGDVLELRIPAAVPKLKRAAEFFLQGKLGDLLEQRERRVKITRFSEQAGNQSACAAAFTSQRCKGHLDDHGGWIAQAYTERLERLGLSADHPEM